jgi:predicted KAP-like P-loop ATPase
MTADAKHAKLEKKLRELQQQHEWGCVYAMSEAFNEHRPSIDWALIARAAYHAGAAKVIQEALF